MKSDTRLENCRDIYRKIYVFKFKIKKRSYNEMISNHKKQFKIFDVLENKYYKKIFSFKPKLPNNNENLVNKLSKSLL